MNRHTLALLLFGLVVGQTQAMTQRGEAERRYEHPEFAESARERSQPPPALQQGEGPRPVILLTGYWPPSNEMLRHFASDPALNGNWVGANWEGRGYDIHAYFPQFMPPTCGICAKGMGWLEVDYQDTVQDFNLLTALHRPVAIITYSKGFNNLAWELEMNQLNRTNWINDYFQPLFPNPSPPDGSIAAGVIRPSVLPVQSILSRVAAAVPGVNPNICFTGDGGGFLSEFIAYLGVWYQDRHKDPTAPNWCVASGHIHVGGQIPIPTARLATEETLRALIDHVDSVLGCTNITRHCVGAPNSTGSGASIHLYGTGSVTGSLTRLMAEGLPTGQPGLFFYGNGQNQVPFANGFLCTNTPVWRLPVAPASDAGGRSWMNLDFGALPLGAGASIVLPGSTWSFQFWYRDGAVAGTNTSDALEITFCP